MDKIAIISNIDGNVVALEKVLEDIKKRKINHIYCLGDIISKESKIVECIKLIKENCNVVIKSNCDIEILNFYTNEEDNCNNEKNFTYINNLPAHYDFLISGLKVRIIHENPKNIDEGLGYYVVKEQLNGCFENWYDPDILIFGHTHLPFIFRNGKKMLLNPGSVSCKYNGTMPTYMILEGNLGSKDADVISYEIVKVL